MLMIPIALQEQEREHGISSDTPDEQLAQNALDCHCGTRREDEDQGTVTERPSGVVHGHTYDDGQLGEDAHYVQCGRSNGECQHPSNICYIHIYEL